MFTTQMAFLLTSVLLFIIKLRLKVYIFGSVNEIVKTSITYQDIIGSVLFVRPLSADIHI